MRIRDASVGFGCAVQQRCLPELCSHYPFLDSPAVAATMMHRVRDGQSRPSGRGRVLEFNVLTCLRLCLLRERFNDLITDGN